MSNHNQKETRRWRDAIEHSCLSKKLEDTEQLVDKLYEEVIELRLEKERNENYISGG